MKMTSRYGGQLPQVLALGPKRAKGVDSLCLTEIRVMIAVFVSGLDMDCHATAALAIAVLAPYIRVRGVRINFTVKQDRSRRQSTGALRVSNE